MISCNKHPQTEAQGMCTYCGKPFCAECLVEIKGKMYCKDDLGNVIDEARASGSAPSTPVINITNANTNSNNNINQNMGYGMGIPLKSKATTLILCIFLGYFGVHRFYVGKAGTGLLWFFTGSLCGIGWIVDIVMILTGGFRDSYGRPLA